MAALAFVQTRCVPALVRTSRRWIAVPMVCLERNLQPHGDRPTEEKR